MITQCIVALIIVYITAIIGIFVMKKLSPGNKAYPIYVLFVCIACTVTIIAIAHLKGA